jgi:peptide/nickel transport system substrate-binding protein
MKARNALVTVLAAASMLAVVACGSKSTGGSTSNGSQAGGSRSGGSTIVMLINSVPANLTDVPWNGPATSTVLSGLASQLVHYDGSTLPGKGCDQAPTGDNVKPWLAKSIALSPDGKKVTIVLNNWKSAYGHTLSAEDVRWSFARLFVLDDTGYDGFLDAGYVVPKNPTFGKKKVDTSSMIKVIDPHTVQFNVKQANSHTIELLANSELMIYDSTEVKKHATAKDPWGNNWLNTHVADYSGWQLESFEPSTSLTLTANPHWGGAPRGNVSRLILRQVPEAATRAQLLSTGQAQIATGLEFNQYKTLGNGGSTSVINCAGYTRDLLVLQSKHAPLTDERVRQAISMAIDRKTIAQTVYAGFAKPAISAFPSALGFPPPSNPYTYDPAKAKQLLSEAGLSHGAKMTISYSTTRPGVYAKQLAVLLQSELSNVGITADLREVINPADFYTAWTQGNYQSILYSDPPPITDPAFLGNVWFATKAPNNTTGFADPQYDKLLAELKDTPLSDKDKRNAILTQMAQITNNYSALLALVEVSNLAAISDKMQPFVLTPNGYLRFVELSTK